MNHDQIKLATRAPSRQGTALFVVLTVGSTASFWLSLASLAPIYLGWSLLVAALALLWALLEPGLPLKKHRTVPDSHIWPGRISYLFRNLLCSLTGHHPTPVDSSGRARCLRCTSSIQVHRPPSSDRVAVGS